MVLVKEFNDIVSEENRLEGVSGEILKVVIAYEDVDPGFVIELFSNDLEPIYSYNLDTDSQIGDLTKVLISYPKTEVRNVTSGIRATFDGSNPIVTSPVTFGHLWLKLQGLGMGKIKSLKIYYK